MTLAFPCREALLNRFPMKHLADAASLAQILLRGNVVTGKSLGPKQRLACLRFYFGADGNDRLHVATLRSGLLWSELGMILAIDLADGGGGEYTYEQDLFWPRDGLAYRRLDWRIPMTGAETMYFRSGGPPLGKHIYWHSRHPYFRIRSAALKRMRIVVVTRSILDILESSFFKHAANPDFPEITADDQGGFDWQGVLGETIEFCNSWGDVMRWHPNIRHYQFEQLKADPVESHREILAFWGFDVPRECVEEGFRLASKKGMRDRIPQAEQDSNYRVSFRNAGARGVIPIEIKRKIIDRLNRELIHDLGHHYDHDTVYGRNYD